MNKQLELLQLHINWDRGPH